MHWSGRGSRVLGAGLLLGSLAVPLVGVGTGGVRTALASCIAPRPLSESLASAPAAFVGTVLSVSNGDRTAIVKVEQVWKGPALSGTVEVDGGPTDGSITSVDRTYQVGVRYLFVPVNGSPPFQDNNCSATQPYTADLAQYRPAVTATRQARSYTSRTQVNGLRLTLWAPKRVYEPNMRASLTIRVTNVSGRAMTLYRSVKPFGAVYVEVVNGARHVLYPKRSNTQAQRAQRPGPGTITLRPGQTIVRTRSVVLRAPYVRPVIVLPGKQPFVLRGKTLKIDLGT